MYCVVQSLIIWFTKFDVRLMALYSQACSMATHEGIRFHSACVQLGCVHVLLSSSHFSYSLGLESEKEICNSIIIVLSVVVTVLDKLVCLHGPVLG